MLVIHYLSCFSSGSCKAHSEDNAVQSAFKKNHQVGTGHPFHFIGFLIVISERFLQHAIDEFSFLLFSKLKAVFTTFLPALALVLLDFLSYPRYMGSRPRDLHLFKTGVLFTAILDFLQILFTVRLRRTFFQRFYNLLLNRDLLYDA